MNSVGMISREGRCKTKLYFNENDNNLRDHVSQGFIFEKLTFFCECLLYRYEWMSFDWGLSSEIK